MLADDTSCHAPLAGKSSIKYLGVYVITVAEEEHFFGWEVQENISSGEYITADHDFEKPSADLKTKRKNPLGQHLGRWEPPAPIPEHFAALHQAHSADTAQRQASWSQTVQAGLQERSFNVLQGQPQGSGQREPVAQWSDNRVHYDGVYSYAYDAAGNRTQRSHIDGSREDYGYDGEHRLVHHSAMNAQGQTLHTTQHDYDALGRRLRRRVTTYAVDAGAGAGAGAVDSDATNPGRGRTKQATPTTIQTTHYGWDGDRLVYVQDEQGTTHTVYEPGSFVPLLRITQPAAQPGEQSKQAKADAMAMLGMQAGGKQSESDASDSTDWQAMNASLASAAYAPLPEVARQVMREMGLNPDAVQRDLKQQVAAQQQRAKDRLTVHLYHCNHLGTPVALVNEQGSIDWAIELDAWGNTVNEYNPKGIEQPIRMQGQQLDPASGLFYNRHRFYDPQAGRYVNQDPIGLNGGTNWYTYPVDPNRLVDPKGLQVAGYPSVRAQAEAVWNAAADKCKKAADFISTPLKKAMEGASLEGTLGGTIALGIGGFSQSTGAVMDTTGRVCATSTTCGFVGPIFGGSSNATASVSTGTVSPGSIWQFGGMGSAAVVVGGKGEVLVGSDGSIEGAVGKSLGFIGGGALMACRKVTTEVCNSK